MELTTSQMMTILLPIALIQLALTITALIVCARAEETRGPKWMWVLIILLVNIFGAVLFFIFGRKQA
ncbi:PLD nuclease N-terminal domain-containing protein [Paenibacillus montanisoli]|uniref:Transcriptional regulator n=1 Tax=Paenibacillus montanisoli TaxID=2081970 RepID=A0A328TU61_9BACL|nr:PLD nuclease N-terminal domain-containing protein [Paenibacillus montanisoli]RAP73850.1 transcriptional regulator [Paenibacillus montanisoli]